MALKIVSGLDVTSISLSSYLDLAKNELRNAQIQNLTTTQINGISSPATGQFAFDTNLNKLKVYNGTAWELVGAAADDSTIELSSNTLSVKDSGITAAKIASSAVTTAKIAADAVTGAKIADDAIDSEHYVDGSIDSEHLANGSVNTNKLAGEAVTSGKIQDRAVTLSKLAAAASTNIFLGRITTGSGDFEELTAADARTILNVADGATNNAGTVTSVGLTAAGGINVSGSPITTNGSITVGTTGNLQDLHGLGVVDAANKFIVSTAAGTYGYKTAGDVRTILNVADGATNNTGALADLNTVNTAQIEDDAITPAKIADSAVDTSEIRDAAVSTDKVADDAITGAKIAALTVATGNIAASAVTSGKIATGAVGTAKLADDAVSAAKIADNVVGAAALNVSGNGTSGQVLVSGGDGSFSWQDAGSDIDVNTSNLTARLGELGNVTISQSGSRVTIGDELRVEGDLTVQGTTTTVNSTTVTVDDPIFTLGGDSAPASDDNKDRGIEFRYHDGTNAKVGFFGWDDSLGVFTGFESATNTSEVFSGTLMDVKFGEGQFSSLELNGTDITATAAELNIMSGVTATATELNKMDGVNVSTADINSVTSRAWAYTAKGVAVAGGTATINASDHDVDYPADVQVYDETGQLVLCDVRQTVSGDNDITINAADGNYDVVITGKYRPVA